MQSHIPGPSHRAALLLTSKLSRRLARPRTCRAILRSYYADVLPVEPLRLPPGHRSLLPLVHSCNNLVLPHQPWHSQAPLVMGTRNSDGEVVDKEHIVPFVLSHGHREGPVGFLRPQVASALEDDHQKHLVSGAASPWDLKYTKDHPKSLKSVAFAAWINEGGKYTRTMHIEHLVDEWRRRNMFPEVLKGWSDEAYPVYTHPPQKVTSAHDPLAFAIERAALPLFGLVNFGALLTAFVRDPASGRTKLWIPRRSLSKRTWPGKLDVTVGGGMGHGDTAMDTIIRESAEEALLDHDYVKEFIRPVGVLPFPNRSPGGWILPGMYYLFDLPLPADGSIIPKINALDGEVEKFELLDVQDVLQALLDNTFKSSSALAIVDFLIRHGYITEATDPRYLDVCRLLKTDIQLPVAWRPDP
ncbi:hypothetical protein GALMADRAFT_241011 [Galerina marginata CBS 339.88]|uniref:Nudix hydrolase domain-containing protein n=1 Tax=Galerina marginata (strain CBS 339.88) TaxID=685588 RepID=A0A067TE69_GALM3|nr:hypothetical protein GALMADRAFT_241011 [Galerina marginata CBS 339.88]